MCRAGAIATLMTFFVSRPLALAPALTRARARRPRPRAPDRLPQSESLNRVSRPLILAIHERPATASSTTVVPSPSHSAHSARFARARLLSAPAPRHGLLRLGLPDRPPPWLFPHRRGRCRR